MAAVDEVAGVRAAHVILADLAEGTFPAREAVEAFLAIRPGVPPDAASRQAFSREMLRFLRVIGSAESSLVLIYPTTDLKGQDLLRAGFLDELMEHLTPEALAACHRSVRRLDPALVDSPELAGSPGDRRVRAVALARTRGEPAGAGASWLRRAGHRRALDGTAAALQVLARRLRGTPFGEYDGLLKDGDVVLDVADAFPPEYLFSASQLETYIGCPFQFFCKYVLKLEPAERRDEIDEDYTERGSKIHDMLEMLEQMKRDSPDGQTLEELEQAALEERRSASSRSMHRRSTWAWPRSSAAAWPRPSSATRSSIASTRATRAAGRIRIGSRWPSARRDRTNSYSHLEIGRGSRAVRLQGKIDRIDIVDGPDGRGFRVIDYKSGQRAVDQRRPPGPAAPAPALCHGRRADHPGRGGADAPRRRLLGAAQGRVPADRLRGMAGRSSRRWNRTSPSWSTRLRRGVFVVDSQIDGCEGFCDFRAICRIRQARLAAKHHDRPEPPELAAERPRAAGKGRRGAATGAGTGGAP